METEKIHNVLRTILWVIAAVCVTAIALLNIGYITTVSYDAKEIVSIHHCNVLKNLILLAGAFTLTVSAYFLGAFDRLKEKKLFAILTAIYCVAAVYLMLNVAPVLRADAKEVLNAALNFKAGDYTAFQKGGYLYRYPHQLGLLFYELILMNFSENPQLFFLVNFLMVLGINFVGWKISDRLFHCTLTNTLTILLSFAFLPQLFFILFAYGTIPGFFFLLCGFYYALRYADEKKGTDLAAMALYLGAAVLMKQNYLIGVIAVLIFLFLQMLRRRDYRLLAGMLAVVLCVTLPGKALSRYYERKTESDLDQGCPSILWVAMGTDIDNYKRGPGWYNSYNFHTYLKADSDPETAAEEGKRKLQENLEKIRTEPVRSLKFFFAKTVSQWCDPMYQSVWSGPMEEFGQQIYSDRLQSLYDGENGEKTISGAMKLLCLALWVLAAGYLFMNRRFETRWELMYLYMIGGLLFHTVWEGKSQYTYPYLFVLIPFAAAAGSRILKRITGK